MFVTHDRMYARILRLDKRECQVPARQGTQALLLTRFMAGI